MAKQAKKTTKKTVIKHTNLKKQPITKTLNLRALVFILIFAAIGGVLIIKSYAAPPAGKGGGKSASGTLKLEMVTDTNTDGLPNYGEQIRFNVSTTATEQPHVNALCYQNGTLVYSAQAGYFDSYPWPWTQTFTLSSSAWTSGGADCTAKAYYFDGKRTIYFASLNFTVNP